MHKVALLAAENRELRQANNILSRRRRAKRTRLQNRWSMTIQGGQDLIDQMDVNTQVMAESSRSGGQGTGWRSIPYPSTQPLVEWMGAHLGPP
jgi:hypothetical protein